MEPSRPPFTWPWFLLSWHGRASRNEFWLKYQIPSIALLIAFAVPVVVTMGVPPTINVPPTSGFNLVAVIPLLAFQFLNGWANLAVQAKRCHDRNRSAWFMLIAFIPIIFHNYHYRCFCVDAE